MTRRIRLLIGFCFLCLFEFTASGQVLDQTDNQFWSDVQISVPVTSRFDFNVIGGLRIGRDFTHPVDERIGAGFTFRAGKYVTVAPSYLHIGMQPFPRQRVWENRLSLPVTVRFNVGDFRISDRNLVERRLRNSGVNSTRYRNRFQVDHPVGAKDWQLSFFIADEVFYDWTVDRWVRNRFYVGGTKVFNKYFMQELYYVRQNDGLSVPGDLNVLGTTLRFRL